MSAFILSGPINTILAHVQTYLDELSSNLATKAVQTSMQTTLGTTNTNVSTILTRVPATVASSADLAVVDGNVDAVLADTADMQPRVVDIDSRTSAILTDTAELVPDVNAVLTDTAALDSRLNATWAGRLDTTISSRLSTAIRIVQVVSRTGAPASNGSGIDTRYIDMVVGVANYTKCVCVGTVLCSRLSGDAGRKVTGTDAVYFGGARMINNSTLRMSSEVSISGAYISGQVAVVEFY